MLPSATTKNIFAIQKGIQIAVLFGLMQQLLNYEQTATGILKTSNKIMLDTMHPSSRRINHPTFTVLYYTVYEFGDLSQGPCKSQGHSPQICHIALEVAVNMLHR